MIEIKKLNNYRQYSYSENNIKDLREEYSSIPSSELSINLCKEDKKNLSRTEINLIKEDMKEKINCKKICNYTFKRFLMFTVHISLIALFEIIFFFTVITNFENSTFINLISSFTSPVSQKCLSLNSQERTIITDILNSFVNITTINENANEAF
jgi:hypothetical protein